jgi:hypothetical protein
MRLLELFSGTGSIGRAFESRGWEVISLDILPGATITSNILHWEYKNYPPGHFDFIWASPPCTEYSIARTRAKTPRDFETADAIVKSTLEIIEYFKPPLWLIENPATGFLKTREIMRGIPWRDVTYCRYGFPYRKHTRLWGFFPFSLRPVCRRRDTCDAVVDGRHAFVAKRGGPNGFTLRQLYAIPPALCEEIAILADVFLG